MDDVDALIKPTDFIECLDEYENAANNFNAFGASSLRFILQWIKLAKTIGTRAKRVKQASELADKNQKKYQVYKYFLCLLRVHNAKENYVTQTNGTIA